MEKNTINYLVWKFKKANQNLDLEELQSIATLAYLEAKNNFDPSISKAKINTVAYQYIRNALLDYAQGEQKKGIQISLENISRENKAEYLSIPFFLPITELLEGMEEEARIVCKMILVSPEEYLSISPKMARGKIFRKLRKELSWPWLTIWLTFAEIKSKFK